MPEPEPTVAIPVRDGGELLERTLAALARQTVEHELLVCDSGSSDGSAALARAHGARVLEIAPAQLQPRRHAQPADGEAAGAHVALLTQDAEPADERWLERLLGGFELARGRGDRVRALPPAPGCRARRCASSSSAGSARSSPDGSRAGGAPASAGERSLPVARADRQARLLHRRQRLPGARGLGARAVSRGSLRRGPGAGDRHAAGRLRQGVRSRGRGAALPRLHDAPGAAPLLRRVARAARGLRLARAGLPGAPARGSCAESSGGRARADRAKARPPRAAARRSRPSAVTMSCCRRGSAARLARRPAARGRAAQAVARGPRRASRRWTSDRQAAPPPDRPPVSKLDER